MAECLRVMLGSQLTDWRQAETPETGVKYIRRERETPQLLAGCGKELYLFCLPKSKRGKSDPRLPSRAVNSHTTFKKPCLEEIKSGENYRTLLKSFQFSYENVSTVYLPKTGVL